MIIYDRSMFEWHESKAGTMFFIRRSSSTSIILEAKTKLQIQLRQVNSFNLPSYVHDKHLIVYQIVFRNIQDFRSFTLVIPLR